MAALPDIQQLRSQRPEVNSRLAKLESEGRAKLAKEYTKGKWCFGVLIAHDGVEALTMARPRFHGFAV